MMNNIEVLTTAMIVMKAHNQTHGYITFHDIDINIEQEKISFKIEIQFMDALVFLCHLLNLSFHIGAQEDKFHLMQIR